VTSLEEKGMKRLSHRSLSGGAIAAAALALVLSSACGAPADQENGTGIGALVVEIPVTTDEPEALMAFEKGLEALDLGHGLEANALFRDAVEIDPGFAYAWLNLANSANSATEFKESLDAAAASLEGKSDGERLLVELTRTFLSNDTDTGTRRAWELVEAYPASPRAWIAHGFMQASMNLNEEARDSFSKALELDSGSLAANVALWSSYLFSDPVELDLSRAHAERMIALRPGEGKTHELLGDSLRAAQDLEGATAAYTRATELDPDLSVAQLKKGHVSSFLGRFEEAREAYDAGIAGAQQLNRATYANYRAFVHLHADDPRAALDELGEILRSVDGMGLPAHQARSARMFTLSNRARVALHHGLLDEAEKDITALAELMRQSAKAVGDADYTRQQEAAILVWEGRLAVHRNDFETARAKAQGNRTLLRGDSNPRRLEAYNGLLGLTALSEGDGERAVHLLKKSDLTVLYNRYLLAEALESAGRRREAAELYGEVGHWNFNSVGFALVRRVALSRAG
jgi:tetratricopeptide (TPR) repeat protein